MTTKTRTAAENKIATLTADLDAAREVYFAAEDEALPIIQAAHDAARLEDAARARTAQALAHAGEIRQRIAYIRSQHPEVA